MARKVVFALGVIFLLGSLFNFAARSYNQNKSYNNVDVFITPLGYVAFFDKNTGNIYFYDSNMEKIIKIKKIVQLGLPLSEIH